MFSSTNIKTMQTYKVTTTNNEIKLKHVVNYEL